MNVRRLARLTATTALVLCAGPLAAFDISNMSKEEQAAFEAAVRTYLVEHPEVLVDAQKALQAKQDAAQADADAGMIAAHSDMILKDGVSFVGGNPDGDLTVVEFIDYRCGYCRKAHDEVAELVKSDGNIRYVVKEFPILGDESVLASRFAISVLKHAGPEAYAKVNDGFYKDFRGEITPDTLASFAASLGIDAKAVMAGMEDASVMQVIEDNHRLAQALQISGTPTFVLGDTMLRGYVPLPAMRDIVKEVRG